MVTKYPFELLTSFLGILSDKFYPPLSDKLYIPFPPLFFSASPRLFAIIILSPTVIRGLCQLHLTFATLNL